MKLLLDTHTFLWLVDGNSSLSVKAQTALADPLNPLFLSVASVWEMAIKVGNGKLRLSEPLDDFVGNWTGTYQLLCCRFSPLMRFRWLRCRGTTVTRSIGY